MRHDPLADALSQIKNAERSGHRSCIVTPSSKLLAGILRVMQEYGYIKGYERQIDGRADRFQVHLNGNINDCGVIKPRFSVPKRDLEHWEARYLPAQDFGVLIMTTTAGVVSNERAKEDGVGGKLLAFIY